MADASPKLRLAAAKGVRQLRSPATRTHTLHESFVMSLYGAKFDVFGQRAIEVSAAPTICGSS